MAEEKPTRKYIFKKDFLDVFKKDVPKSTYFQKTVFTGST